MATPPAISLKNPSIRSEFPVTKRGGKLPVALSTTLPYITTDCFS
jgi:hypothetical protein